MCEFIKLMYVGIDEWLSEDHIFHIYISSKLNLISGSVKVGKVLVAFSAFVQMLKFNSLSPRRCGCDFRCVIFKHNLVIDIFSISHETALKWMTSKMAGQHWFM